MKLFRRKQYDDPAEKKLSVMRFWFFTLGIFSFVVPFAILYIVNLARSGKWLMTYALRPTLIIFAIVVAILVIVYFVYRSILMQQQK
jgi:hypothetical protein